MADYTFKYTDPSNGVLVVHDNTANGHLSPANPAFYINPITGVTAVSANTSLVFIGKSIAEYGEVVQNNMIYMMEHFSNKSRPLTPIQGQIWNKNADFVDSAYPSDPSSKGLYIWTGSTWDSISLASGMVTNLNMNGYRIINLGDPIDVGDAISLGYADDRYLRLSGGIVTGPVTFNGNPVTIGNSTYLLLNETPTQPLHAANKKYVDDQDSALQQLLTDMIDDVIADLSLYVLKSGDTMSGTLTLGQNASLVVTAGGTGTINMGAKRVQNVLNPVANQDAATRFYVDTSIQTAIDNIPPPVIPPVGTIYAGSLNSTTGVLTFQRTEGLSDIVVSGTFAPFAHTQAANTINVNTEPLNGNGLISQQARTGALASPTDNLQNIVQVFDQAITTLSQTVHRQIIVQASASQTSFTLEPDNSFPVDSAKLMVFKNGIKQYATERGMATARFNTNLGIIDGQIIDDGSYTFSLIVDGTTFPFSITANSLSFYDLLDQIQATITSSNVPCVVQFEQLVDGISLYFKAISTGPGSSVVLVNGTLFGNMEAFTGSSSRAVTVAYSYAEDGLPGQPSTTIEFVTAPSVGDVIEFLISP